jgi:hypothetical protein
MWKPGAQRGAATSDTLVTVRVGWFRGGGLIFASY